MNFFITITFLTIAMLGSGSALGFKVDRTKPRVGEPMPDFTLTKVTHYPKKEVSLADFKGKWLILDFWFTGCTSAIKSLPQVNALHLKFQDRIQIMMVGINGHRYKDIEQVYRVLTEKYDLQLASAYDSLLHVEWDIWSMPYVIIIDPHGIVRHITTGRDMDEDKLQRLLDGTPVKFHSDPVPLYEIDVTEFPGTRDSTLVYRSVLTKWTGQRARGSRLTSYNEWTEAQYRDGIILVGYPLARLYKIAYTGRDDFNASVLPDGSLFHPRVVLEVSDPRPFWYDTAYSAYRGRYNYNLSIVGTKTNSSDFLKTVFQAELRNAFGYNVAVEEREFEILKIDASRNVVEKLATRGGEHEIAISPVRMQMQNVPIETFFKLLIYQLSATDRVFLEKNETGFEGNIDIDLNAVLTDIEDVKLELRKIGFEIVKEKRDLKTLVIRDSVHFSR